MNRKQKNQLAFNQGLFTVGAHRVARLIGYTSEVADLNGEQPFRSQ